MTPYRDAPRSLLCPRCGELLEGVFEGALACLQCAGVWLAQPIIDLAFGSPSWPHGASAWWKIEIECPECAVDGTVTALVPYIAGNVMIDRCTGHGIWLDAGELGRLMKKPEHEELVALYRLLQPVGELPQSLAARRSESEAVRVRRRQDAAAERARIADLRRRRETEDAVDRALESDRAVEAEANARKRLEAPPAKPVADPNAAKRVELQVRRAQIATKLAALDQELNVLRDRMLEIEQRARAVRTELRAVDVSLEEL